MIKINQKTTRNRSSFTVQIEEMRLTYIDLFKMYYGFINMNFMNKLLKSSLVMELNKLLVI